MTYKLNEIEKIAQDIINQCYRTKVWLFYGDMGAGKTTLIKAICKLLGVYNNTCSPTYSIVNEYETSTKDIIYHFDLYRIKLVQDLYDIGFNEYLSSGKLCLIEWPERANFKNIVYSAIRLKYISEIKREIKII